MTRTLAVALATLLSTSALASELWVELDIQGNDKETVHIEVPYTWLGDVNLDDDTQKIDREKLERVAVELPVGKSYEFLEAKDEDGRMTGTLHHRKDNKKAHATYFYVRGTGGEHGEITLSLPIALLSAMSGMVGQIDGPDEIELGNVLGKLGGMAPFKLAVIDGPDEHLEIGTE